MSLTNCPHCGKEYLRYHYQERDGGRKFCSKKCYLEYKPKSLSDLLMGKREIDLTTGCWNWTGYLAGGGYGRVTHDRRNYQVHRVSANIYLGFDLDSSLFVCHHCDNRRCFNPDHLFIGTALENSADMKQKGRQRHKPRKGSQIHSAKLTEDDVLEICEWLNAGASRVSLASVFHVTRATIARIAQGRGWKHVPLLLPPRPVQSSLTEEQVQEIREWINAGASTRCLAAIFNVSGMTVRSIAQGKTWNKPNCQPG